MDWVRQDHISHLESTYTIASVTKVMCVRIVTMIEEMITAVMAKTVVTVVTAIGINSACTSLLLQ